VGDPCKRAQQSLAADGATACFSSNLFLLSVNADRAPQLKASVRRLLISSDEVMTVRILRSVHICYVAMALAFLMGCHAKRPSQSEGPVIDDSPSSPVVQVIQSHGYRAEKRFVFQPTPWEVSAFRMRTKRLVAFRAEQPLPNERETYYCRFSLVEESYDSNEDARQRLDAIHRNLPGGPVEDEYTLTLRDGFRVGKVAYILSTDASIFHGEIQKLTKALVDSIGGAEGARVH
jgi:hypothetical protein